MIMHSHTLEFYTGESKGPAGPTFFCRAQDYQSKKQSIGKILPFVSYDLSLKIHINVLTAELFCFLGGGAFRIIIIYIFFAPQHRDNILE